MTVIDRPRIDELDGLRGLLALWVAVAHMLCWVGFLGITVRQPLHFFWWEFIYNQGAVQTFMILSGFAISFLINHRPQPYGKFILGRAFRLYPVYLVCLVLGLLTSPLQPDIFRTTQWKSEYFDWFGALYAAERAHLGLHLFWHLTLLNGLLTKKILLDAGVTILPPAWSISLEWQYYLVAPWIGRMVRSTLGLLSLLLVTMWFQRYGGEWINFHWAFLPPQLPLFVIGIGSYHFYEWFCRAGQPRVQLMVIGVVAMIAVAVLAQWYLVPLTIWALVLGCIFVRGNDLFSRALSVLRWFLLLPWMQKLGRMSYCIYLLHWPMILILLSLVLRWRPGLSANATALLLIFIGLPLTLLASLVLHEYLELPFMALGKKLTYPQKKSAREKPDAG